MAGQKSTEDARAKHAAYMRKWRQENPEKAREIDRRKHQRAKAKDRTRFLALQKAKQQRYRDRKKLAMTEEERHRLVDLNRERNRVYRERHRGKAEYLERIRVGQRRQYAANPEAGREKVKRYQRTEKGREAVRKNCRLRRAREKQAEGVVTRAEWLEVLREHGRHCHWCLKPLEDGADLTMDHLVALSKGGPHTKENVVPACRSCNSSKGAKSPDEFAKRRTCPAAR